ncbi:MAG: DUF29 family protein [Lyngbya sp.]|nr:DUF29 family protein [Lyngbya sp.]
MEEIIQLKELLLKGDIQGSLAIVNELEEMSRDDIINNIRSSAVILLIHIIKQQTEHRTTRSWDVSIRNSILEIRAKNKRRKSGGVYLPPVKEAYPQAINKASLEVEEGRYEAEQLEQLVSRDEILNQAMQLILTEN